MSGGWMCVVSLDSSGGKSEVGLYGGIARK